MIPVLSKMHQNSSEIWVTGKTATPTKLVTMDCHITRPLKIQIDTRKSFHNKTNYISCSTTPKNGVQFPKYELRVILSIIIIHHKFEDHAYYNLNNKYIDKH